MEGGGRGGNRRERMGWLGEKREGKGVGLIPLLNTQFLCMCPLKF